MCIIYCFFFFKFQHYQTWSFGYSLECSELFTQTLISYHVLTSFSFKNYHPNIYLMLWGLLRPTTTIKKKKLYSLKNEIPYILTVSHIARKKNAHLHIFIVLLLTIEKKNTNCMYSCVSTIDILFLSIYNKQLINI